MAAETNFKVNKGFDGEVRSYFLVIIIFSNVKTPKNLDIYVASDVINITKIILVVICFSNKKCNSPS